MNNIIPAWALENPYRLPLTGKWYYYDDFRDKRFGPYNTKAEALRAMELGEAHGRN